jgi:hypothetical protein
MFKIKLIIVYLIMVLICATCNEKSGSNGSCLSEPDLNKVCTKQYVPVCGCDGKNYPNACLAKANGVNSFSQGECGSQED